jgi:pimeloyl-ACP methyl ester carboxylesterase
MLKIKFITSVILFLGFINITINAQLGDMTSQDSVKLKEEALTLIFTPEPTFETYKPTTTDSTTLADMGLEQIFVYEPFNISLRDGGHIFARKYLKDSETTIILLHGVLSNSYFFNKMSGLLRDAANAEVISIDLRGHGQSSGRRGDVDYIGQYSDDLAEVVTTIREEKPNNKIILAGHSMGGGIILRYAQRSDLPSVDGYLLFAPSLGHDAPTLPSGETSEVEPFLKIHINRIVGLYLLNAIGIHEYDSLNVLFFNQPEGESLRNYSYRSNMSNAPEYFEDALKAINRPLLVIVGSEDEAYIAEAYEPAIKKYSQGEVVVINGATHNGVRHDIRSMEAVKLWIKKIEKQN